MDHMEWSLGWLHSRKDILRLPPPPADQQEPGVGVVSLNVSTGTIRGGPPVCTGVGSHFLLQGIFLTQGSNPRLLRWQVDS